jgi:hypothetical protein
MRAERVFRGCSLRIATGLKRVGENIEKGPEKPVLAV